MYKDKYYKKLEREYMSATGMVPTTSQLSEFFYEKKQMGKEYSLFLESLGLKEQSQIIEIGKGNVDSLAHSDTMKNISFTEISPYVYSFDKDFHIDKIYGNLELNKERIVIINSLTFPKTDIGNISSIIVEGDLNYSHLPIYSNLYSCSNALYFGIFGKKEDKNFPNFFLYLKISVILSLKTFQK